jgi:ABC-2 type transport system permease protein
MDIGMSFLGLLFFALSMLAVSLWRFNKVDI